LALAEHFIGQLAGLECLGRLLVTGAHIGVKFLGAGAPRLFHILERGVGFKAEHFQRAHLVAATGAIAASAPAIVLGFGIAGIVALFIARTVLSLFLVEPFEVVPVAVVFRRVLLAEVPA